METSPPSQNQMQSTIRPMTMSEYGQHVQVLGWLYLVGHGLFLLIGVFVFFLLSAIGVTTRDPTASVVLSTVGLFVAAVLTVLAVPGMAAGVGLLRRRNWARILAIVVGVLGLANVPIGTLIGVYAILMLTKPEAAEYFYRQDAAPGPTTAGPAAV